MVRWPLIESGPGVDLTVAGPAGMYRAHFGAGESPVFGPGVDGVSLKDGSYTWELRRSAPLRGRVRGEGEESHAWDAPSGTTRFGFLQVVDGAFVVPQEEDAHPPSAPSDPFAKDQIILDDLIVDGKLCVGFGCINNEPFGDELERLKSTTVRLLFLDTSTSPGYPTNDWNLVANDSFSGGASYFAITDVDASRTPFLIEAGARNSALYVEDTGRIGLGTAAPVEDLHIVTTDSPTLRLEQTTGGGFAAQSWNIGGNETNLFIQDASTGQYSFRVQPGAPTSSLDVDNNGNVGIGTNNADADLHVIGKAQISTSDLNRTPVEMLDIISSTDNTARIRVDDGNQWNFGGGGGNTFIFSDAGDPVEMTIDGSGNVTIAGTLTESSDVTRKHEFGAVDAEGVLERVLELPLTTWSYRDDAPGVRHLGPMAQDFHAAFGLGASDKGLSPRDVASVALAAVQGLHQQVETLERQNGELLERLAALEAALAEQE
jgi:hypothetical protein